MSNSDKLRGEILSRLAHASRDLSLFTDPSPEQRKAKERFWRPFVQGDLHVPSPIDLASALKFGGDSRIRKWWDLPGFIDWFTNQEEFKDRVEFVAHLALDSVEEVLKDKSAPASARVAAAKLAMEIANKLPKSRLDQDRFADEKVNEMDKQELEQFIQSKIRLLPAGSEKSLTVPEIIDTNK